MAEIVGRNMSRTWEINVGTSKCCIFRITIEDVTRWIVWRPDTHRYSVFRIVNFEHKWYCRGDFWRSYAIVKIVTTRNIETSWQLMNCSQLAEDLLCYNVIKVTISDESSKHNFKYMLLQNVLFRTDSLLRKNSQIKGRDPKYDLTDRKL